MAVEIETDEQVVPPTLAERDRLAIARLKGVAGVLLLLLAAVSFTAGVPGLLAAGGWAQLGNWAWLTPILVDGGVVFYAVSAAVYRSETGRAAVLPWSLVLLLSTVSVASQVVHVLGASAFVLTAEAATGAVVASLFPLVVLSSTRIFENLRFGQLIDREAKRAGRGRGRVQVARPDPARKAAAAGSVEPTQAPRPATQPQPAPRAATAIDPAVKAEAIQRVNSGQSQRAVAADLKVSRGAVQAWCRAAA